MAWPWSDMVMGRMTKDCGWRVTQQWAGVKTLQGFDLKKIVVDDDMLTLIPC